MPPKQDGMRIGKAIAKSRSGMLLSTEYINNLAKMKWQCGNKHKWEASLNNVRNNNSWCAKCASIALSNKQRLKDGLEVVKKVCQKAWWGMFVH